MQYSDFVWNDGSSSDELNNNDQAQQQPTVINTDSIDGNNIEEEQEQDYEYDVNKWGWQLPSEKQILARGYIAQIVPNSKYVFFRVLTYLNDDEEEEEISDEDNEYALVFLEDITFPTMCPFYIQTVLLKKIKSKRAKRSRSEKQRSNSDYTRKVHRIDTYIENISKKLKSSIEHARPNMFYVCDEYTENDTLDKDDEMREEYYAIHSNNFTLNSTQSYAKFLTGGSMRLNPNFKLRPYTLIDVIKCNKCQLSYAELRVKLGFWVEGKAVKGKKSDVLKVNAILMSDEVRGFFVNQSPTLTRDVLMRDSVVAYFPDRCTLEAHLAKSMERPRSMSMQEINSIISDSESSGNNNNKRKRKKIERGNTSMMWGTFSSISSSRVGDNNNNNNNTMNRNSLNASTELLLNWIKKATENEGYNNNDNVNLKTYFPYMGARIFINALSGLQCRRVINDIKREPSDYLTGKNFQLPYPLKINKLEPKIGRLYAEPMHLLTCIYKYCAICYGNMWFNVFDLHTNYAMSKIRMSNSEIQKALRFLLDNNILIANKDIQERARREEEEERESSKSSTTATIINLPSHHHHHHQWSNDDEDNDNEMMDMITYNNNNNNNDDDETSSVTATLGSDHDESEETINVDINTIENNDILYVASSYKEYAYVMKYYIRENIDVYNVFSFNKRDNRILSDKLTNDITNEHSGHTIIIITQTWYLWYAIDLGARIEDIYMINTDDPAMVHKLKQRFIDDNIRMVIVLGAHCLSLFHRAILMGMDSILAVNPSSLHLVLVGCTSLNPIPFDYIMNASGCIFIQEAEIQKRECVDILYPQEVNKLFPPRAMSGKINKSMIQKVILGLLTLDKDDDGATRGFMIVGSTNILKFVDIIHYIENNYKYNKELCYIFGSNDETIEYLDNFENTKEREFFQSKITEENDDDEFFFNQCIEEEATTKLLDIYYRLCSFNNQFSGQKIFIITNASNRRNILLNMLNNGDYAKTAIKHGSYIYVKSPRNVIYKTSGMYNNIKDGSKIHATNFYSGKEVRNAIVYSKYVEHADVLLMRYNASVPFALMDINKSTDWTINDILTQLHNVYHCRKKGYKKQLHYGVYIPGKPEIVLQLLLQNRHNFEKRKGPV